MEIFDKIKESVSFLKGKAFADVNMGIVLGSGLGDFADELEDKIVVDYGEIPGFKKVNVTGHAGKLILGSIKGRRVAVMQGRYHFYEGHSIEDVVFPVRVLAGIGVKRLLLTNAAGGVNKSFKPGDLMIITDHINLMGANPLVGSNDERMGVRFPDMSEVYGCSFRELISKSAEETGLRMQNGVYAGMKGPSYETPAEIKMLDIIGADAVGMSTVPEAIAARHMGVEVAGISCITNMAAGISGGLLDHKEVTETAQMVKENFIDLLKKLVINQ